MEPYITVAGLKLGTGKNTAFLDFDGVVNTDPMVETAKMRAHEHPLFNPLTHLDPVLVQRVYRLVEEFDCDVVLSTSWVDPGEYNVASCRAFLCAMGWRDTDRIIGRTPRDRSMRKAPRHAQIHAWLQDRGEARPRNFVIIDDNPCASNSELDPFFVRTLPWKGFDEEAFTLASDILKGRWL